MIQHPEDDSSEVDVEEPPLHPSLAEASAALHVLAKITTFENADRMTWEFF